MHTQKNMQRACRSTSWSSCSTTSAESNGYYGEPLRSDAHGCGGEESRLNAHFADAEYPDSKMEAMVAFLWEENPYLVYRRETGKEERLGERPANNLLYHRGDFILMEEGLLVDEETLKAERNGFLKQIMRIDRQLEALQRVKRKSAIISSLRKQVKQ